AILTSLIPNLDAEWTDVVSAHARRLELRIDRADDPLLTHWETLPDDAARARYLTILRSIHLDAVLFGHRLGRIYQDAIGPRSSPEVRDAARKLMLTIATDDASSGTSPFGLLVPRESSGIVIGALRELAAQADADLRHAALRAFVRLGYDEEAI